jgi:hypothetical protein
MAIRRVKPRTVRPKRKPKLGLKDVLGPRPSKKPKRDYPVDKSKKKKLPHEKLLDKYLKGDIPFTIPSGVKSLKDLLKPKKRPEAKTGPIKSKKTPKYGKGLTSAQKAAILKKMKKKKK